MQQCETQRSPKPKLKHSKKNAYNEKLEEILNICRKLNWQNIKMISWRLREYLEKRRRRKEFNGNITILVLMIIGIGFGEAKQAACVHGGYILGCTCPIMKKIRTCNY